VRVGCDTTCALTATASVVQRSRPARGKRKAAATLAPVRVNVPAGESRVVRLVLSRTKAAKLRKALRGRRGLAATIELIATAAAGEPTEVTKRLNVTG
jgi:hypothetical protein